MYLESSFLAETLKLVTAPYCCPQQVRFSFRTDFRYKNQPISLPNNFALRISCSMADDGQKVDSDRRHAVVCGAGVIGACTAYFLASKGLKVTVVEKCGVACAASGKAGGFLAYDWSSGAQGQLANASYKLHKQLAAEIGVDYGYRTVETLSISIKESPAGTVESRKSRGKLPEWIDGPVSKVGKIGTQADTAQVHPKLFTKAMIDTAVRKYGAELQIGEVQDVVLSTGTKAKVTGVKIDGKVLPADIVVLALGPWSSTNHLIKKLTHISGLKANSIVLRPKERDAVSAHMLFLQYQTREGKHMDPEVYPRPNGEVYVCGMSETVPIPDNPDDILPSLGAPDMLKRVAAAVSSKLADADVATEQACFLPCSEDGVPIIGPIPGAEGAYVATGHSCWGILNAPATGLSLAELIVEGKSKLVDLKSFSPERFMAGAYSLG